MIRLNHNITYKDNLWKLTFSVNQSDVVPNECLLTRNGKFIDVCTIEDFKNGIGSLIRVSAIELSYPTLNEAVEVKNEIIRKISTLKENFENLMLTLRDDSITFLKL